MESLADSSGSLRVAEPAASAVAASAIVAHYWPLADLPEIEISHCSGNAGPRCEYHETFAVAGVIGVRAFDRLRVVQPGDLQVDASMRGLGTWQLVRIPRIVIEREAARCGLTGPITLATHAIAEPSAIVAFTQLHWALRRPHSTDDIRALLSRCIDALVGSCCHDGARERRAAEHVSLRLARAYMAEALAGSCRLEELARIARVGKFQLIKLFRRRWGMPPKKLLMHMRVARARLLLSRGALCTHAAQETGFCDQSHLNRWFHRVYGLSPGAYVRQRQAALLGDAHG